MTIDKSSMGDLTLRLVAQPRDVNFNGHAFGGWILSQMDIAGGVAASKRAQGPIATAAIEAMEFHKPVYIGDHITVYTKISHVGRTSITTDICICAQRRGAGEAGEEVLVTEGRFIYVAIDSDMTPRPLP